MLMFILLFIID